MALCKGDGNDHCCWLPGGQCQYLRDDGATAARRWVCTLRERVASFAEMHQLPEYVADVRDRMVGATGVDCGDWPRPTEKCNECGVVG